MTPEVQLVVGGRARPAVPVGYGQPGGPDAYMLAGAQERDCLLQEVGDVELVAGNIILSF